MRITFPTRNRRFQAIALVVMVGVAGALVLLLGKGKLGDLPSAKVEAGTFIVSLTETGELGATKSVTVSAPRVGNWSTRPQIVKLVPEGTTVKKDDFLAQFDTSALEKTIEQKRAELEIAQADLSRARAVNEALLEDLTANLANVRAALELAELQLEQMQFEAEVKIREQELHLERSRNDVKRAETKLASQRVINAEDVKKLMLRASQAEAELHTAIRDKESLTIEAPMDGLVVYPKVWSGGTRPKKVQEGDTPWPGQAIIELPDLSEMEVTTEITEVDISKVKPEQHAEVRLDAFPDSLFFGTVTKVATLAKEKDEENPVKVFEVSVLLEESSPILRPGMTASVEIFVAEIPEKLWIPIDAVFTEDDTTVAYVLTGGKRSKIPLALGPKNEDYVVVEQGLEQGQSVSLLKPGTEKMQATTSSGRDTQNQSSSRPGRRGHAGRRRG